MKTMTTLKSLMTKGIKTREGLSASDVSDYYVNRAIREYIRAGVNLQDKIYRSFECGNDIAHTVTLLKINGGTYNLNKKYIRDTYIMVQERKIKKAIKKVALKKVA